MDLDLGLSTHELELRDRARAFAAEVAYYDVIRAAPEAEKAIGVRFLPRAT